MNTPTMLHHAAMEFYDLAGIYKAKGKPEVFDDYRKQAWLLEREAALQMLADPEEYTFKYVVIRSAGLLGYNRGEYQEAKKVIELGLMGNPPDAEKIQMEGILEKIAQKTPKNDVEGQVISKKNLEKSDSLFISGTLTSADIEDRKIKIRESGKRTLRSVSVSKELIKKVIRFYLGELVLIQVDKDKSGTWLLKNITKTA